MNLLIELYDYPCGVDFYYIQDNDVKEFDDEIVKKLREISIDVLTYYFFMDECLGFPFSSLTIIGLPFSSRT